MRRIRILTMWTCGELGSLFVCVWFVCLCVWLALMKHESSDNVDAVVIREVCFSMWCVCMCVPTCLRVCGHP